MDDLSRVVHFHFKGHFVTLEGLSTTNQYNYISKKLDGLRCHLLFCYY